MNFELFYQHLKTEVSYDQESNTTMASKCKQISARSLSPAQTITLTGVSCNEVKLLHRSTRVVFSNDWK